MRVKTEYKNHEDIAGVNSEYDFVIPRVENR